MTFRHGVASGDPLHDRVLLWTRWSPPGAEEGGGSGGERTGSGGERAGSGGEVAVDWAVATDAGMGRVVSRGTTPTGPARDFTVSVDAAGLAPATTYWYRFAVGGTTSPVGRTRTAPAPGQEVDRLRLGLVSCASYAAGWFHVYRNLARRDVDLVVHTGDYIYENGRHHSGPRAYPPPHRCVSVDHYRRRHALHKSDPDLQALHARHPMVAVWDDHELAGGTWVGGAREHDPAADGPWERRKAAALQAYWEWMPVRQPDPGDDERVYRRLRWGDLADIFLLDTRLAGRDRPPGAVVARVGRRGRRRSLLGERQRGWLESELAAGPPARWRVLCNQVMLSPAALLPGRMLVNGGQWDGYPGEREWLYRVLAEAGGNAAVLSGDIHSSWAADLPVGAEFVTPAVSAVSFARILVPPLPGATSLSCLAFRLSNPHLRMVDLRRHGYVVLDVSPERVRGEWWHLDGVKQPSPAEHAAGAWQLRWGRPGLERAPASTGVLPVEPPGEPPVEPARPPGEPPVEPAVEPPRPPGEPPVEPASEAG